MTKIIDTLVEDIYEVINDGHGDYTTFANGLADRLRVTAQRGLRPRDRSKPNRRGGVWFSNYGDPCLRKLWYGVHRDHHHRRRDPSIGHKFLHGNVMEDIVLELAKLSGHSVVGEQRRVKLLGASGRIDAIIDGVLTDVKTASPSAFRKFKGGLKREEDSFGNIPQLRGYLHVLREVLDKDLVERNEACFLVINRGNGEMHLDRHTFSDAEIDNVPDAFEHVRRAAEGDKIPERAYEASPEGKSGNLAIGFECQFCDWKHECWPGLRTFEYKYNNFTKLVDLCHIEREPRVKEIKDGDQD